MKWFLRSRVSPLMNLAHFGNFVRNASVPRWKKVLAIFAVAYAVFPFDFIPDAIPVLGWLDDVGVLGVAFTVMAREMGKHASPAPG